MRCDERLPTGATPLRKCPRGLLVVFPIRLVLGRLRVEVHQHPLENVNHLLQFFLMFPIKTSRNSFLRSHMTRSFASALVEALSSSERPFRCCHASSCESSRGSHFGATAERLQQTAAVPTWGKTQSKEHVRYPQTDSAIAQSPQKKC